ncbi:hypothetical protein Chor_014626 [Crotalus horridus]
MLTKRSQTGLLAMLPMCPMSSELLQRQAGWRESPLEASLTPARVGEEGGHLNKQKALRLALSQCVMRKVSRSKVAFQRQEDLLCPSIPSPGISVARRVSGKGAMRSHMALPLLLFLLCALLAEGNPKGGRKKGPSFRKEAGMLLFVWSLWWKMTVAPMAPTVLDQLGLPAMKPPPQSAQWRHCCYLSSTGVGGIASATETSPAVELLLSFTTWGGKEKHPGANWCFGKWRQRGWHSLDWGVFLIPRGFAQGPGHPVSFPPAAFDTAQAKRTRQSKVLLLHRKSKQRKWTARLGDQSNLLGRSLTHSAAQKEPGDLWHNLPPCKGKEGSRRLPPKRRGPPHFQAKFLLYSNRVEQGCLMEPGQEEALQQCPFNASVPLVMIIHGWSVDRRLEGWIWKLSEELKTQLPYINVIIADWLSLAHAHYPIAVQNTRDIGQEIARFLEWLEESMQFHRSNAHLVGYSLGAHVAGFAGSSMRGNGKIGRITGLDPAGPLFEGMSPTDRLSPDDANFVDAIHTFTRQHMGLSVGIKQPVAHFDFYPNGGTFQPGCHIMHVYNHIVQYGITGLTQTVKCAHERSVHLFIDSLRYSQKQITGYWCKNMQMFDKGRCLDCRANRCNTLGYHIRKARVLSSQRLFLKTQPQMPFKVYHYQFKIHFIHEFQEPRIDPTFTISLTGNKDDVENLSITLMTFCSQRVDNLHLYPGHEKMFVRCEVSSQRLK